MLILLRSLVALAAALIGFVAGGIVAGACFVPAASGFAGGAIAAVWAMGAALGALVAAIFVGSRLRQRNLRIAAAMAAAGAAAASGYIAMGLTAARAGAAQEAVVPKTPLCGGDESQRAAAIAGEVAAGNSFTAAVDGWTFTLQPQPHGWLLSLLAADGRDLTAVTPPFHGLNPRQLDGWHFRNAANTQPNDGSVNAPQHLRQFQFAPSIEGSGGFKPPRGDARVEADGHGWLFIEDMELTDLEPGHQARIARLRFSACLTWPKSYDTDADNPTGPVFAPEEIERFAACGLRPPYELSAWITPRQLDGDLDGDGVLDAVATVVRASDGARGLAVCRAGTHLHLLGFDPLDELDPAYLAQVEAWTVKPRRAVIEYAGDARLLPPLDYDVITLERIEKSSYTLYWSEGAFHARLDYRVVTGE